MEVKLTAPRQPNQNAYAERFVLSVKSECLDKFCVFGEAHLRLLLESYESHYNEERPHQGLDNVPLPQAAADEPTLAFPSGKIVCEERLGGLLKHYHWAA